MNISDLDENIEMGDIVILHSRSIDGSEIILPVQVSTTEILQAEKTRKQKEIG